ncbi:MAG: DNA polymerase III subunit gamma/tau [Ignavibacteria bacterium]|jgi:DNA polymerase-3 subunit gamma/tau
MSYVVTARKWRPQKFNEVVGQQHITKTLVNAINKNRIAHAFIFAGPRGVGKTTTARILAKSLNCLNQQNGEPCNECEMCTAFNSSQSLDIIEIDGASNRRIEEIRTLRESVKYAPTKGQFKVYIIDEVHMLTPESFNALLKTLEEPPEHTIFIFATTDIHKVPLTIISRCQRFDFRRIEIKEIKALLKKIADAENIKIDDQSLTIVSKKADGALRDAQSLFDQVISFCGENIEAEVLTKMLNLIDEEIYFTISDSILNKKFEEAFNVTARIYDNGWNFIDFIDGLVEHFRNIMTAVIRKDVELVESAEVFKERYLSYKDEFSEGDLLRILTFLNKSQYELKSSRNQKLYIEIALTHLIGLEKSSTITELVNKLGSSGGSKINVYSQSDAEKKKPEIVRNGRSQITDYKNSTNLKSQPQFEKSKSESLDTHNLIKDTKEEKSTIPIVSFSNLDSKWKNFVEQVQVDKPLKLGSIFQHIKLINIEKDCLKIVLDHPEDKNIIESEKEYFAKKTKEIFGKKLEFEFSGTNGKDKSEIIPIKETTTRPKNIEDEPPLIQAIIKELGGREIK